MHHSHNHAVAGSNQNSQNELVYMQKIDKISDFPKFCDRIMHVSVPGESLSYLSLI